MLLIVQKIWKVFSDSEWIRIQKFVDTQVSGADLESKPSDSEQIQIQNFLTPPISVANNPKVINTMVADKSCYIRGPYVVFEVEYLWNDLIKKNLKMTFNKVDFILLSQ